MVTSMQATDLSAKTVLADLNQRRLMTTAREEFPDSKIEEKPGIIHVYPDSEECAITVLPDEGVINYCNLQHYPLALALKQAYKRGTDRNFNVKQFEC